MNVVEGGEGTGSTIRPVPSGDSTVLPGPHALRDPTGQDSRAAHYQRRLRALGWVPWWHVSRAEVHRYTSPRPCTWVGRRWLVWLRVSRRRRLCVRVSVEPYLPKRRDQEW